MAYRLPSSEKTIQLLWVCFFISNLLDLAHADPPYKACSNISANSQFQKNLEIILSYLRSNASVSKLYSTSTGNDHDKIYAQYMCLNYETNDNCRNCIATASEVIMQLCPEDKDAVVWEETCQLRYSNQSFLGHLDVSGNMALDNKEDLENPAQFRLVVNETLNDLAKQTYLKMIVTRAFGLPWQIFRVAVVLPVGGGKKQPKNNVDYYHPDSCSSTSCGGHLRLPYLLARDEKWKKKMGKTEYKNR
ncbi:CYSTEINE-RICH REPEAT SECRETORY PROTEIN [Salix viminalis]|uniref:CYSTEINE-RICH REPEAT SECRETORY PROTEIN n=1 Tax=Salix viminalis TaxID=40686 RepID=A0A9Q0U8F9_SALVM|nr:CYSTEINE-RICH REPEAT SECRETORY PROTEIN [Salix viminalis]